VLGLVRGGLFPSICPFGKAEVAAAGSATAAREGSVIGVMGVIGFRTGIAGGLGIAEALGGATPGLLTDEGAALGSTAAASSTPLDPEDAGDLSSGEREVELILPSLSTCTHLLSSFDAPCLISITKSSRLSLVTPIPTERRAQT
jgi:hypothetical protein